MEIRQLRYFLRIAELGSFSRASVALHIAQPALSHQIAQLEAELGHALLHRRHHGVQVTQQGQAFYSHVQRILKAIDDLPNVVNGSAGQLCGTVTVGLPQSTASQYGMPLLDAARKRYVGVGLELFDEISGNLMRGINSGHIDIAVIVSDEDALLANSTPLMDEELFLVTSMNSDIGQKVPVAQLAMMSLALPGVHHGVRALVEDAVRAQGSVLPTTTVVANSMSIMRKSIEAGQASGVMPWAAMCDEIHAGTVRAIPMEPRLTRRVHVCWSKDAPLSLAAVAIRDLLIEVTRERVLSGVWLGAKLL
jgi:LysR family nitrogen assimilation transcriptional regulator